jgi:hypothetical protein
MIWESRYWKVDLLRFADRLRRARTTARSLSARAYVTVEKAVLMGAFMVRRLADSHKLSDATLGMQLRVTRWPSTGRGVTLANNHRLDELFDFSRPERSQQPLPFLCNQAIHSYVFATYSGRSSKGLAGVYLASDRQRNRALFAVPLSEWERAFRKVGTNYPTDAHYVFDDKFGDYRATVGTQRTARRGPRFRSS